MVDKNRVFLLLLYLVTINTEKISGVYIMSTEDRAKATAKNIEGKAQEAMGNVTGDKSDQAEGKAKQAEASTKHAVEDGKDAVKDAVD